MESTSRVPGLEDAPLQLTHILDHHLQLSLMDTNQSSKEAPRCLQHKSPPPHYGRPLERLRHERLDSYPQRTSTSNEIIRKLCLGAFGHICRLHPGTQSIDILASTPPSSWRRRKGHPPHCWTDQIKETWMSLSDAVIATHAIPSWKALVRGATCPMTQTTQAINSPLGYRPR